MYEIYLRGVIGVYQNFNRLRDPVFRFIAIGLQRANIGFLVNFVGNRIDGFVFCPSSVCCEISFDFDIQNRCIKLVPVRHSKVIFYNIVEQINAENNCDP